LLADLVETASGAEAGISVLLIGPRNRSWSRAVEALAAELDRPLHRIDLSRVVSKYIGETEKNLSRLFDAAEEGGAVLLFDEADALFGARSEAKDGDDRYQRLVGYLLGRMHGRTGLSVVAVESRDGLSQLQPWFDEVIDLDSDDETG